MVALPSDSKMSSTRPFSHWAVAARRYRPSRATSASRSAPSSKRPGFESSSRPFSRPTPQRAPAGVAGGGLPAGKRQLIEGAIWQLKDLFSLECRRAKSLGGLLRLQTTEEVSHPPQHL